MDGKKTVKIYALDLDREEWATLLVDLDQPKFRVDQIVQWLWRMRVDDADEMTNLSKSLRDELKERVDFALPALIKEQRGADGTRKYLWQFRDGKTAESVLMKHNDRLTACVSTQVGCPLQCIFCATGLSGYERNLSPGEIAAQFLAMEKSLGRDIANIVYMGMGEPFLNTANVLKSVRMLNDEKMRNLGIRHFTISTAGILPGIIALANSGLHVRLAVSLHAVDDELRGQLMPVNQKYPVAELRGTMEEYQRITGDRITVEYALFGGVNDSVEHARALVRYLRGLHVFINLIPFNAVDNRFEKPTAETVLKFRKVLDTAGFESEIRQEHGADIDAACGQLRRKTFSGEPCPLDSRPGFKPGAPAPGKAKAAAAGPGKGESNAKAARGHKRPSTADGGAERPAPREQGGGFAKGRAAAKPRGREEARERRNVKETEGERRYERNTDKRAPRRDDKKPYERSPDKTSYADGRVSAKPGSAQKHRKTDKPESDRYRSGKMKEERPGYKGRVEERTPPGEVRERRNVKETEGERGYEKSSDRRAPRRDDKKPDEKSMGKTSYADRKPAAGPTGAQKRGKTCKPESDRYRGGKMKEERPGYKGRGEEKTPSGEAKWFEGATKPRRPKSKKATAAGAAKTSMTGAKRRAKTAPKSRAKKK